MTVSVVVPWSPGCPHRERAWEFVQTYYDGLEVVTGDSPPGPYSRSAAIVNGARRASGDMLVVADADVFPSGPLDEAIEHAERVGWAVPHLLLHRLSAESTVRVYAGEDWRDLPLSTDNRQDAKPYRGNETGTLVVIRRGVLEMVPPDPRFVGWGQEDTSWALALRALVGPAWRGTLDLVHLWHPAQPRQSRVVGSADGLALHKRYRRAKTSRTAMERIVAEAREVMVA